jgi:hypothetical protein
MLRTPGRSPNRHLGIQPDAVVLDWRRRHDQVVRAVEPDALDTTPAAGRYIRASALFAHPIWRLDFGRSQSAHEVRFCR